MHTQPFISNPTTDQLEAKELEQILKKALNSLPEKTQLVFQLKRFGGLSHKEIAAKLKISSKATEYHLTNAVKHLLKIMNSEWLSVFIISLLFLLKK